MNRAIFLDRDGVILEDYAHRPSYESNYTFLTGALEALALLATTDYKILVVTNQSWVAKGVISLADLEYTHLKISQDVANAGGRLDKFYACIHTSQAKCGCRKPKVGMLLEAKKDFNLNLHHCHMVGDRDIDMRCAIAAGVSPHFVLSGVGNYYTLPKNIPVYYNVLEFAKKICSL